MNLLSPLSLILFVPLGAAIIVLYLLKLKRKDYTVSSVLLWQDAIADLQANAPFQKLKKNLLMILQLLALLLLALAVARPYIRAHGVSENKIAIIIDTSASMQSTDVSPSRFDSAKSKALDIVNRIGPGDTMLVISAGAKTQVVVPFTSDKRALSSAISKLTPVDTNCNMRQAMALALSLVAGKSAVPPRIVILSDGLFDPLSDLSPGKSRIDFVRIGRLCDNVAIVGMDSRKTLSGDQQLFVSLRNFSKRKHEFNLELYIQDQLYDVREESLAAGEAKQEIISNLTNAGGRVTAKLDISDDLQADNFGSVYLTKPRRLSILMVSKGNIFLQNALNLDPRTQLVRANDTPSDLAKQRYDLVIFDRLKPPSSLPSGGYLLIDTESPQGPATIGASVQRPMIIDSNQKHPISKYVDFNDIRIANAHYLKPKNWAVPLIEGENGAFGVAGSRDGLRFAQISFNLLESDFPLHVGFPIFVANCLDWLVPAYTTGGGESIHTGQAAYIDIPPDTRELTITDPAGQRHKVKVTTNPVIYENTERTGIYTVRGIAVSKEFACNVASPQESSTSPKSVLTIGSKNLDSTSKGVQTNREFYGWLIFAALAIMAFEWYTYHRRL